MNPKHPVSPTNPEGLTYGLDFYKPTMSQLIHYTEPDLESTFTFHNRGTQRLMEYVSVSDLQERFDHIQSAGWNHTELQFLAGLNLQNGDRVFNADYLTLLREQGLPEISVGYDPEKDDLAIQPHGPAELVTFWETVVMSEVNEAYFESYARAHNLDLAGLYNEGDRRLDEKIALLRANPDIAIADFGTRRHFSLRWHQHVLERLVSECPHNVVGTSNIGFANMYGLKPIGTFAHEMPMVYAGLADARGQSIRASHHTFLEDWYRQYGPEYSVALTDTFGTDFFFADFTPEQAMAWHGVRHDSGSPYTFGERLIDFYNQRGIDPRSKAIVFSDGLDIDTIIELQRTFGDRINVMFGWGTTLTNDLGPRALSIVMKATQIHLPDGRAADLVKLSDTPGKHTGPPQLVTAYKGQHFAVK